MLSAKEMKKLSNKTRKSSIKVKILVPIMALIFVGNCTNYYFLSGKQDEVARKTINTDLSHTISAVSSAVSDANEREKVILDTIAHMPQITSDEVSLYDKSQLIFAFLGVNKGKYIDMCILDTEGNAYVSGTRDLRSFAERSYYKEALKGKFYIEKPFVNKVTNSIAVFYSIPVYNKDNKIINVVFSVVEGFNYSELMREFTVGQSSHPMIFDRETGALVGCSDLDYFATLPKIDDMDGLSGIKDKILSGKADTVSFTYSNSDEEYIAAYMPVKDTTWTVMVAAPLSEFNNDFRIMQRMTFIITLIVFLVTIILAILLLNGTVKPLKNVNKSIYKIATGDADLTQRLVATTHDEIGTVVAAFNTFVDMLSGIIVTMKDSKEELATCGNSLESVSKDTTDSVSQIISKIEQVESQLQHQIDSVEQTISRVTTVSSDIVTLDSLMEQQVSDVKEATSSVNEMIGSINQVGGKVEKMATSFEGLLEDTKNGSKMQEDVNQLIKEIEHQSDSLGEANAAIAAIAEQTNLLAMNAAIEAAHAGEAGKGFSVVADEIRKLSETSSDQSKTIGEQLQTIKNSIEKVVSVSEQTIQVFNSIIGNIDDTNVSVKEIRYSIEEQEKNSSRIEHSLEKLGSNTKNVYHASEQMQEENNHIQEEIKMLELATSNIKNGFDSMGKKTSEVRENSGALEEITTEIRDCIGKIGSQIDLFKV